MVLLTSGLTIYLRILGLQGEIKDTLYELKDFRRDIISLIERLNAEIRRLSNNLG